jgi:hypothetical protein
MAVTKIHAVKATVGKAIDYVMNPDKTDEYALVDTFACSREFAKEEFLMALKLSNERSNSNQAYHIIQSFKPGEATPSLAHDIGIQLADRILEGRFSYIIATHVDKEHVHNHILVCAADNLSHSRFNDTRATYYTIRKESDFLCEMNGLSVIKEEKGMGKCYKEWMESRNGTSWKSNLKKDISSCIKSCVSYDDFIRRMIEKGYQIKGEKIDNSNGKYISFLCQGCERWISGKPGRDKRGLGAYYSKESIFKRIEERAVTRTEKMTEEVTKPRKKTFLLRFEDEFFKENPGLVKWGNTENLKRMSEAYAELMRLGYKSLEDAQIAANELRRDVYECGKEIKSIEQEMKAFAAVIKYYDQYWDNKKYYVEYKRSQNPERYAQSRLSEITLFEEARKILKNSKIDPERLNIEKFKASYYEMKDEKQSYIERRETDRKNIEKISRILSDLKEFQKKRDISL